MKQKRKSVLCILLSLCMLLTVFPVTANAASKSNWYKSVLNKKNQNYYVKRMHEGSSTYKVNRKQFKYYKTVDINKDGTKELFLSTTSCNFIPYGHRVVLMTYYKGKLKPVAMAETAAGSAFSYKGKYLCYFYRLAGSSSYDVYRLSGGKLKKVVTIHYDNYTIKNGHQVLTYTKNNRKCSKATYQKYYKKYIVGSKKITYQKIR